MTTILNFSYGSNLLDRRMTQRVPSARVVETAVLRGYVLRWHKAGQDGSAKCDIVASASPDDRVHGVVYELALAEKHLLDAAEGLGRGYEEMQVGLDTASGEHIHAWTYYATDRNAALQPFSWYKALVLAGALERRLPSDYIDGLRAVPAIEDPDTRRAELNWALAGPPQSIFRTRTRDLNMSMPESERVIVALDVDSAEKARQLVALLGDQAQVFKVGLQLLTAEGPALIRELVAAGKQVFLDLKLLEIPNSVAGAVAAAGALGVSMVTVHASGGSAVLRAAVDAARVYPQLQVLALTVITSMRDADLREVGVNTGVPEQVLRLAQLAAQAQCHGVIASPQEAALLRTHLPTGMLIVTPGTQMPGDAKNDQARTATPAQAIRSGSTHVVMGRSIMQAPDPAAAFAAACAQVAAALSADGQPAGYPAAKDARI